MTLKGSIVAIISLCVTGTTLAASADNSKPVDFNRDIRPILSENCYACHGPDKNKRKADLRLDTKEGLFGKPADETIVTPKKLGDSALFKRITSNDPEEVMPPSKTGKTLKPEQIALIKRWIEQGAEWKGHWSYIKPTKPPLPSVEIR